MELDEIAEFQEISNKYKRSEFQKYISFKGFVHEVLEYYKLRGIQPLRLKLKDNTYYTASLWAVDNPRYFLLRAAVEVEGFTRFSAIRRLAIKLAIEFYGDDDSIWNKISFLKQIENLEIITLKQFCKHNNTFELYQNADRDLYVRILDADFSFKEYEERELNRLKSLPILIKTVKSEINEPEPEEAYVSPEIDWDAIERAAKLEFDPDK